MMSNSPQGSRGRRLFLRSMGLNSASSHVPKIQKCSFGFSRNVRHVDETDDLRSAKLFIPFRDDLFERDRHRDYVGSQKFCHLTSKVASFMA
jgi:hypothetical protein